MDNHTPNRSQVVKFGGEDLNLMKMAEDTGISVSHLSRIFRGNRTPSLKMASRIADHLKCSLDNLFAHIEKSA